MATINMNEFTERPQEFKGKKLAYRYVEYDFSKLSKTSQSNLLSLGEYEGVVLNDKKGNVYFNPPGLEQELHADRNKQE